MAISPFMIPLAAAVIGLDFLRRQLLPDAPETNPVAAPYTPPFTGGQCNTLYAYDVTFLDVSSGNRSAPITRTIQGAITDVSPFNDRNGTAGIDVTGASGKQTESFGSNSFTRDYEVSNIRRVDGQPDNCGNLPNPNPSLPIASDGLASSSAPVIDNDSPLVQGAPIVAIPPLAAIVANIVTAVKAAVDALAAAKSLADAIKAIADTINGIKDWLDDKNKDDPTKKTLFVHNYGRIRKDGFLRLYPNGEVRGYQPVYLDLQLLSIPIGYGKYFGNLSPNFYRFKSLGHISFVSPTFGVLKTVEIEFSRTSVNIPENAFGFFYHLGLEDTIRANASLFYLKPVE